MLGGVDGEEPDDESACLDTTGAICLQGFGGSRGTKSVSYFWSSGNQNASVFSLADPILHVTSGASCISEYMQIQAQIKSLIGAMEIEIIESYYVE